MTAAQVFALLQLLADLRAQLGDALSENAMLRARVEALEAAEAPGPSDAAT